MAGQGQNVSEIARHLGHDRKTIRILWVPRILSLALIWSYAFAPGRRVSGSGCADAT